MPECASGPRDGVRRRAVPPPEPVRQLGGQVVQRQVTGQLAVVRQRNDPGLLGNHQHQRIGFVAHAHGRQVPAAQRRVDLVAVRRGKLAVGRQNVVAADDHPQVVQRRSGVENRIQQIRRYFGVDHRPILGPAGQIHVTLNGDQRPVPVARQVPRRLHQRRHKLRFRLTPAAEPHVPHANHRPPQLRLKDHQRDQCQPRQHVVVEQLQPHPLEVHHEDADHDRRDHQNDQHAAQRLRPTRALQHAGAPVHAHPDQQQLHEHGGQIAPHPVQQAGQCAVHCGTV